MTLGIGPRYAGGKLSRTLFAREALHVDAHESPKDVDHAGIGLQRGFSKLGVLLDHLKLLDKGWVGEVFLGSRVAREFAK